MQIETVALNKIIPYIRNPRKNDNAVEKVASSIKEFGFRQPIVVDSENVIIAGHTRFEAAKRLGLDVVPIHVADGLTEQQAKAYRIADNRVGQEAEWDYDLLKLEMEELDNPELTGFDEDELNGILAEVGEGMTGEEGLTDPDQVPEAPAIPITVPGDLWELGGHRLLCDDATKPDGVKRLMDGEKADMVFTDPPYSSGGYQESGKGAGSVGARHGKKIENDNLSTRGYIALMDRVIGHFRDAYCVFIFCDWKMWATNQDIAEAKGFRVRNMIVWDKMQMGMGMPFRNQHELCLFGSKIAGKIGNGRTPNVLQFKRDREANHATPKPVPLIKALLDQIESKNVIDPFLGSGSTLIACQKIGRKCYGMEIDPQYCDVIITRWSEFTGKDDLLLNGKPFKWSERKIKKAA